MLRSVLKIFGLTAMLVVASAGVYRYQQANSVSKQVEQLQDEKRQIEQVVSRLSEENRVADILVSHQDVDAKGIKHTTLLFVEYDKKGNALPARSFTIEGENAPYRRNGHQVRARLRRRQRRRSAATASRCSPASTAITKAPPTR